MNFVINLFNRYGLIMIFTLIGLEYACFPIPSEVVLPFAGFVAKSHNYSLIGVILLSVIVGYLGSLICYAVGWYGGGYLYNKIYNKYEKMQKGLDVASLKFEKYGNLSVFGCRLVPLCRTYISFLAGTFKQGLLVYSLCTIGGILIWNSVLISLGYILASNWQIVLSYYDSYKFILIIIVMFFVLFLVYKRRKRDKTISGD